MGLAEFVEQAAQPLGDPLVAFDLVGPAALLGVTGELLLDPEAVPQARSILRGGDELRARQVQVALAGALGGQAQAAAELEIKLPAPATEPMRTQTGRQETGFVIPPDPGAEAAGAGVPFLAMLRRNGTARRLDEPLPTFAASGQHHALIHPPVASPVGELDGEALPEALVVANFNPGWSQPVTLPLGAFTARDHHALLVPCGGAWNDQAQLTCRPLPTQTSSETHALLLPTSGHLHDPSGTGRRCRLVEAEPMPTQTADKEHALVQLPREFLVPYMRTGRPRRAATDPWVRCPAASGTRWSTRPR